MNELRAKLLEMNKTLLKLIGERKLLSKAIQDKKAEVSRSHPRWDVKREKEVITTLSDELQNLSLKERLAFSLLMEDHAQGGQIHTYPSFSSGEHLGENFDITHMLNPLLLSKEQFLDLELKRDFQERLSVIENEHE